MWLALGLQEFILKEKIKTFISFSFFRNQTIKKAFYLVFLEIRDTYHFNGIQSHGTEVSCGYSTYNNKVVRVLDLLRYFYHADVHSVFLS